MIAALKYPPLKSAVNKVEQLPRVLFYKATGCKSAKCAKGAEGLYNTIDTTTGQFLGSIDVRPSNTHWIGYLDLDRSQLYDTLNQRYLSVGGKKVKLPYAQEYENVYEVIAKEETNLNSEEQQWFAWKGLELLKNLSDRFKRPIVFQKHRVPNSMKIAAIENEDFVAIAKARYGIVGYESKRAIDGKEMSNRYQYLMSKKNGWENRYNEQTYKNVDKYLENNEIDSLVYAECAIHPKVKRPNLITAVKEFFIDTKCKFNEIRSNINENLNKEIKVTIE